MSTQTKFFTFIQNNSGGSFDHDAKAGIGYRVAIEAVDATHAKARASQIGLYFNGCDSGRDCSCCGEPLKGGWGIPSYVHYLDGRILARNP